MSRLANLTNSEFYEKFSLINQYNKRKEFVNPTKLVFYYSFKLLIYYLEKLALQY